MPIVVAGAALATAPSFLGGLLLAIANPKAFAAIGAVFTSVVVFPAQPMIDASIKSAALVVLVFCVNIVWLVLGAALSRLLRHPRLGRLVNIGFAVSLLVSVALAVLV